MSGAAAPGGGDGPNGERVLWLESAYRLMREEIYPEAPDLGRVHVSFSWPSRSAGSNSKKRVGECGPLVRGEGGAAHFFISIHPVLFRPGPGREVSLLGTLLHEAVHAGVGLAHGHRAPFSRKCRELGFEGKPTANYPGEGLTRRLNALLPRLPGLPEGWADVVSKSKGSRLRLYLCGCAPPVRVRVARDDFRGRCLDCGEEFRKPQGDGGAAP